MVSASTKLALHVDHAAERPNPTLCAQQESVSQGTCDLRKVSETKHSDHSTSLGPFRRHFQTSQTRVLLATFFHDHRTKIRWSKLQQISRLTPHSPPVTPCHFGSNCTSHTLSSYQIGTPRKYITSSKPICCVQQTMKHSDRVCPCKCSHAPAHLSTERLVSNRRSTFAASR